MKNSVNLERGKEIVFSSVSSMDPDSRCVYITWKLEPGENALFDCWKRNRSINPSDHVFGAYSSIIFINCAPFEESLKILCTDL